MFASAYRLPILSGILLACVFYPMYAWPLAFVALVPLFSFAASKQDQRTLFKGGFLTGLIGMGPLVYSSLFQLRIIAGGEFFSYAVRASALPILLLVAALFGLLACGCSLLRTRSPVYNSLVCAALYVLLEAALFCLFGGYYLGSLAHAVVAFPGILVFASLGGALFVSGLVAWFNSALSELICAPKTGRKSARAGAAAALVFLCALFLGSKAYLGPAAPAARAVSAAVIQVPYQDPQELPLGSYANGKFTDASLEKLLMQASDGTDLVIYPFSPFRGATYEGEIQPSVDSPAYVPDSALGDWLQSAVPASTTVLLWNSAVRQDVLYDQYALWKNQAESTYQKRQLYALSDYVPAWASLLRLRAFPYTIHPGDPANRPFVGGIGVGGLICSELHQPSLARKEALRSPFIIAIGSDAMFPYDLMGSFSLAAARYRAAENNIPIVRGNINGPSAFINADGSIQSSLGYFKKGIVRGTLEAAQRKRTIYSLFGTLPLYLFVACILASASVRLYRRRDSISPSRSDRD